MVLTAVLSRLLRNIGDESIPERRGVGDDLAEAVLQSRHPRPRMDSGGIESGFLSIRHHERKPLKQGPGARKG